MKGWNAYFYWAVSVTRNAKLIAQDDWLLRYRQISSWEEKNA